MKRFSKLSDSEVWKKLADHRQSLDDFNLVEQFNLHADRFQTMHLQAAGLILDYSKNFITKETIPLLIDVVESLKMRERIEALFEGGIVNPTENLPALHTSLRDFTGTAPFSSDINLTMSNMEHLVEKVLSGEWKGSSGKSITDVVNIGIGGSHLGPMMVSDALSDFGQEKIRCHFVSNIDTNDIYSTLEFLSPESTLFVVSSKSFITLETLHNAKVAKSWLGVVNNSQDEVLSKHFLAVTARPERAHTFGIPRENILQIWDWVGGRYALWSPIGIAIAFSIGMDNFNLLRKGAAAMDSHFREIPFASNLPVILAVLEIWYINYWGVQTHAVLPYGYQLRFLPEFLQQLEMESNGKSVDLEKGCVEYKTASVLWGTVETNGQHSFHQLLHQGTHLIPVDFIVSLRPNSGGDISHLHLYSNCLAQSNVLMTGTNSYSDTQLQDAEHRKIPGNRPSNTIIFDKLTPESLGALISLYEHKVYVQSVIWNINAFDQWGVELGKLVSSQVCDRLVNDEGDILDGSTEGLIALYKDNK